jgi:signal transduction histidine kinase
VEITLGPLDFDGEAAVTSLIRDITWRKQAEAERDALRAREQAARAEAERLKDEFLASVTHDLRTPVTAIKSSIEVVLANEPPETPTVLHRLLVNANQATDQMASLIDDLLELISLEAGQLSLDYQECDLRQIVRDAARAMEVLTRERRQRLDVVVPACPVRATVDPRRIERVLLNLLSNAHKYGREGGTIQMRVARRGADVVLTVADDGPGISAADQQRIFNRFYRVGASAATDPGSAARAQPQGLGLGLAIARNLVELHGGRLWVESAPGAGARFHVALPRRRQREAPPLPPD